MNKKIIMIVGIIIALIALLFVLFLPEKKTTSSLTKKKSGNEIAGTVMQYDDDTVTIQDVDFVIYTFNVTGTDFKVGDNLTIEYKGNLNKNNTNQDCKVLGYKVVNEKTDENGIPMSWLDNGIFSDYYKVAFKKLQKMTLDEKIAQLLLVRYPDTSPVETLKKYQFGGYIFFAKDFKDKTKTEVKNTMNVLQKNAKIPLLTAVDEEGGTVVRVSSNPYLVSERFKSPSELYNQGGFKLIQEDTISKSRILRNLGLNLNLAPVVDVSTDPKDYMYERTLKQNTALTSTYAKTVIAASKGTGVSYTLKHFPGYGNNQDTHTGSSIDNRTYEEIVKNDLPPFEAGINAKAESVLVSHNTVSSIDSNNPASLSKSVHNLLRGDLDFTGIIITDDIAMGALDKIDDVTVKAILAGNDLIITTDYEESFNSIKRAIRNGTISEDQVDKLAFRILAWKYYKGLLSANQK